MKRAVLLLHFFALTSVFSYHINYNSLAPFGFKFNTQPAAKPLTATIVVVSGRRLLQVSGDSVSFSVVITSNDTAATQTAMANANVTVEGYTSAAAPVFIPASGPAGSISPPGSVSVTQCFCLPGYEGDASKGTDCLPCPIDTFCASGKLGLCPANAHAPALSDSILDCECYPGFYGNGSVSCSRCPINSFCTGGFALDVCVQNAVSPAQSTSNMSCYCDRGYYGVYNNPCVLCTAGSWCWTGIRNECPANSSSLPGTSRISDCKCLDGFLDTPIADNDNQSTSVCTICQENAYCKVIHFPISVYNIPTPATHACASYFCCVSCICHPLSSPSPVRMAKRHTTAWSAPHVPLTPIARPECSLHVRRTAQPFRRPRSSPNVTATRDTSAPTCTSACFVLLGRGAPTTSWRSVLLDRTQRQGALNVPSVPLGPLEILLVPLNVRYVRVVWKCSRPLSTTSSSILRSIAARCLLARTTLTYCVGFWCSPRATTSRSGPFSPPMQDARSRP